MCFHGLGSNNTIRGGKFNCILNLLYSLPFLWALLEVIACLGMGCGCKAGAGGVLGRYPRAADAQLVAVAVKLNPKLYGRSSSSSSVFLVCIPGKCLGKGRESSATGPCLLGGRRHFPEALTFPGAKADVLHLPGCREIV